MRSQETNREEFYARGGLFTPSSYDSDLTMDGTAQTGAIASGASKLKVTNRGAATEPLRIAFGETAAAAEANLTISGGEATTGDYIPANSNANGAITEFFGIPVNAKFYAIANDSAGDTQTVSVTQGV